LAGQCGTKQKRNGLKSRATIDSGKAIRDPTVLGLCALAIVKDLVTPRRWREILDLVNDLRLCARSRQKKDNRSQRRNRKSKLPTHGVTLSARETQWWKTENDKYNRDQSPSQPFQQFDAGFSPEI
jgi:hypothetical protein